MKTARVILLFTILCGFFLFLSIQPTQAQANRENGQIIVIRAEGAITQAMVEYIKRGIETAGQSKSELVILEINTPGGSIDVMNKITQTILSSPVPVVVYVSPRGAMAGSAGTVITLSGQIAAMAPETTIGAASPVGMQGEDIGATMETKVKEMLKATVRSLAERRGAAAVDLAEKTIDEAKAVSAKEALEAGLIDLIADNTNDLISQLDGRIIQMDGVNITLVTKNSPVQNVEETMIEQLLRIFTNPNLVFLLLVVGIQAILIELSSPGGWVAGFLGAVCLALAGYGLGILSVNWFGIIFVIIAFILFVVDIKAPTHGFITIAAIISMITGALVLFNSPSVPAFQHVSVPLVIGTSVILGLIFFGIITLAVRAQFRPVLTGKETIVGKEGIAITNINPKGEIQLASETWSAELEDREAPIQNGEPVMAVKVDGLRVFVRRVDKHG